MMKTYQNHNFPHMWFQKNTYKSSPHISDQCLVSLAANISGRPYQLCVAYLVYHSKQCHESMSGLKTLSLPDLNASC